MICGVLFDYELMKEMTECCEVINMCVVCFLEVE